DPRPRQEVQKQLSHPSRNGQPSVAKRLVCAEEPVSPEVPVGGGWPVPVAQRRLTRPSRHRPHEVDSFRQDESQEIAQLESPTFRGRTPVGRLIGRGLSLALPSKPHRKGTVSGSP